MTEPTAPHPTDDRLPGTGGAHADGADASPWRKRFETIYKSLRKRIILLDYPPGTRLDIEALATEFDVSRTPIRSVVQRLETEGLALTRHGVGTAVTDIEFGHVREAMQLRMHLAALIGTLNPKPARVATLDQLHRLRADCGTVTQTGETRDFALIDMKLHDFKCGLVGNQLLRRTYDEMYFRAMRVWFYFLPRMNWAFECQSLINDIDMTAAAIRRGDVAAIGFHTRNAVSDGLYRIDDMIAEEEKA